jgi:DNA repair protein RadD
MLRPKQSEMVNKIRQAFAMGAKAPIAQAPTGFGKTHVFSHIAESSEKRGKRVLILCHRIELVDQIVERLKEFNVTPDIIAAGYNRSQGRSRVTSFPVAVASVQTLVHRLDKYPAPTLIVIDECHHVTEGGQWSKILRYYAEAKLLGFTATPQRLDSRGLASHFDRLLVGPSVAELIEDGSLARPRVFAPPTVDTSGLHIRAGDFKHEEAEALMNAPSITGDAYSHYKKHADGKPALVFCTSVAHAKNVAERFRSEGVDAVELDGHTDKQVRRMALNDFKDGRIKVITSVEIFSEGVDIPGCHVGIFLRPTASLGLYLQQCGRILRPSPGKEFAILLDHCGNSQRHGLVQEDREWELTVDTEKRKKKPPPGIRVCPKCFAASPARATQCVECAHVFEVKPRQEIDEREGELVELTAEQIARKRERVDQGRARSLAELENFAKLKGYAPGWASHIWQAREAKKRKTA